MIYSGKGQTAALPYLIFKFRQAKCNFFLSFKSKLFKFERVSEISRRNAGEGRGVDIFRQGSDGRSAPLVKLRQASSAHVL